MSICQNNSPSWSPLNVTNDLGFQDLRERAGLTREEVADLVGCEERTVYRWERGEVRPRKLVSSRKADTR